MGNISQHVNILELKKNPNKQKRNIFQLLAVTDTSNGYRLPHQCRHSQEQPNLTSAAPILELSAKKKTSETVYSNTLHIISNNVRNTMHLYVHHASTWPHSAQTTCGWSEALLPLLC